MRSAAHVLVMLKVLRQLFAREASDAGADEAVTLDGLLERGWLELFYQPKIVLKTRRPAGAEGFIRGRHPTRGILNPAEFLPGANDQAVLALTEYVIRTALRDWEAFAARGAPLKLSVNTPVSALLKLPLTTLLCEEREGIESNHEGHKLQGIGCELGQGYLFAKPMPKQQLIGIMHQRTRAIAASSRQASAGAMRRRA